MDFRKNVITLFIMLVLLVVGAALVQMVAPETADARPELALQETPPLLQHWLPIIFLDNGDPIATSTPPPALTETSTPPATVAPTATTDPCVPAPANLLANPGFDDGMVPWHFNTGGNGSFVTTQPAYQCSASARVDIVTSSGIVQLYQSAVALKPNTQYRLQFAAYSTTEEDVRVDLLKHAAPYSNYGLSELFDLSADWQEFSYEFVTSGFDTDVEDGRFRFWMGGASSGSIFWFDAVSLEEIPAGPTATATQTGTPTNTPTITPTSPPTATATQTTTPTITPTVSPTSPATPTPTAEPPTATPIGPPTATATPPVGGGPELLVFDWNQPVELWHHGFPWDNPPMPSANGNWTSPINYAAGTLYFRAEIFSQPVAQNNMMQFCIWQYNNVLENCSGLALVTGTPGNVVTWSQGVQDLWKKDDNLIDWVNPRDRYGAVIKNSAGLPVSDFLGWNWNGEDPYEWYPLNMRFTVIVVAPGRSFSGWDNYISD